MGREMDGKTCYRIEYCSGIYCSPRLLSNYVQLYDSSKTLEYRQDFQSQDVEVIDKQLGAKVQKSSENIKLYRKVLLRER